MKAKTVLVNFLINGLVFYGIGRKFRGHKAGVRLGLLGGLLSVVVVSRMDSGDTAE